MNLARCAAISSFFFLPMARRRMSASPSEKSGQAVGDLHDLFLIQDDAVGFFQNVLQLRQFVS